jgi:hypothetical protein
MPAQYLPHSPKISGQIPLPPQIANTHIYVLAVYFSQQLKSYTIIIKYISSEKEVDKQP